MYSLNDTILDPAARMRGIVLALLLAMGAPAVAQTADARSEIIGKWKLDSVLDLIDITSRNENEARSLLGHVMVIRSEGAQLDDYRCAPPDFETRKVKPNLYVQEFAGIDARKLRLPDPATVVDISCTQVLVVEAPCEYTAKRRPPSIREGGASMSYCCRNLVCAAGVPTKFQS